jgi:hypothetical protein
MSSTVFIVVLGYWAGCYGPIVTSKWQDDRLLFEVAMTCHGPHNSAGHRSSDKEASPHEGVFHNNEWFTARQLDIKR